MSLSTGHHARPSEDNPRRRFLALIFAALAILAIGILLVGLVIGNRVMTT